MKNMFLAIKIIPSDNVNSKPGESRESVSLGCKQ